MRRTTGAILSGLVLGVRLTAAAADEPPAAIPADLRAAVQAYLAADPKKEKEPLAKVLALVKDDVALAARALREHEPLTKAKPGTYHKLPLSSGGQTWECSVVLPKGYDGKKRFPVLVLPDHGSVSAEDGVGWWDGKDGADEYVLFRPVIVKFQEDKKRFPGTPDEVNQSIAEVMGDALAWLRLHYAVDSDRFVMTGLSQAGFYTWYYAVTFPDSFAGVVPESSGGLGVRAAVKALAGNLASVSVRILHARGDEISPYADAVSMRDAITEAKGKVELVTYEDADYPGGPFPKHHPGPHNLRLTNVLPWGLTARREIPRELTRVIRYASQGFEGRFRVEPPGDVTKPFTVHCAESDGTLTADHSGVTYLASP